MYPDLPLSRDFLLDTTCQIKMDVTNPGHRNCNIEHNYINKNPYINTKKA